MRIPTAIAMMSSAALWRATFPRLSVARKPSPHIAKNTNMAMKAMVRGAAKKKPAARARSVLSIDLSWKHFPSLTVRFAGFVEMGGVNETVFRQRVPGECRHSLSRFHDDRAIGQGDDFFMVGRGEQHG